MAQKKVAAKKAAGNNKKAKQVVEEKPELEVEASEDESDASDEEVAQNAADLVDSEAEEAEDDDDDSEDEDAEDDEVEPGEISKISKQSADASDEEDDAADSDEEPVEAPIGKKSKQTETPKTGGIPKVAVGKIPSETPKDQLLFVTNLPADLKHSELIALFTKFGPIAVVQRIKSKSGGNNLLLAFESAEGVAATMAAKPKDLTLNGKVVSVSPPLDKSEFNLRTVVVGLIGPSATKETVTEHFKDCGVIESVNFSNNRALPTAFVRFQSVDALPKALKLHGSELNSRFITVRDEGYKNKSLKSPDCTLTLANTGKHDSYKTDVVEKIFKKFGDLLDVDIVCTRSILGFVTFETAESAAKALKQLQGKTVGDLEIKLESYNFSSAARTVLVTNLSGAVDEQQLNKVFSEAGEIESIKLMANKALVKFITDDGFCKSFLLNERMLQGQPIFLEPNSMVKHKLLKRKMLPRQGKKPNGPAHAGNQDNQGFKKFNKHNNKNNNNKKPFNKRPAQENGSAPNFFKKAKF